MVETVTFCFLEAKKDKKFLDEKESRNSLLVEQDLCRVAQAVTIKFKN